MAYECESFPYHLEVRLSSEWAPTPTFQWFLSVHAPPLGCYLLTITSHEYASHDEALQEGLKALEEAKKAESVPLQVIEAEDDDGRVMIWTEIDEDRIRVVLRTCIEQVELTPGQAEVLLSALSDCLKWVKER